MKKDILAACFIVLTFALMAMPGCWKGRVSQGSATAVEAVISRYDPIALYYVAGLALLVGGGLTFAFGGKTAGGALIATGIGTAWFGQTLDLRPWVSMVAMLTVGPIVAGVAYDRWKLRRGTAVIVEKVETTPGGEEVKAAIRADGEKTESVVRSAITAIKNKLSATGKI